MVRAKHHYIVLLQEQFVMVEDPKLHLTSNSYHVVVQQMRFKPQNSHNVKL